MKKSPIRFSFIIVCLLSLLLPAADLFLFFHVQAVDAEASDLSAQRLLAETENSRLAIMKDSLAKTASDRAKLDSYLIDKDKVIGFLEEAESAGTALGVAVKIDSVADDKFSFAASSSGDSRPSASSASPVLRVSLEATGTWKQAFLLAEEIRALPHKIAFTSLSLQKAGDAPLDGKGNPTTGPSQWRVNMEIVVAKAN